jgi:peptidoglycan hydrolase-like protein with peptidoglycan-binding domain
METGTENPDQGSLLSAGSSLRGSLLHCLGSGVRRLSAVGCVVLLAASLSIAQDSTTTTKQPASHSKAATSSPAKDSSSTSSSAHPGTKSKKSRKSAAKRRVRGQQKIDSQRTLEIQEALIREHYLTGKPTGVWNEATEQAMQRYQAANNWQSKTTPDARALIKLGLGPDHRHLLNPESAMTSQPQPAGGVPTPSPASTTDPGKPQR